MKFERSVLGRRGAARRFAAKRYLPAHKTRAKVRRPETVTAGLPGLVRPQIHIPQVYTGAPSWPGFEL